MNTKKRIAIYGGSFNPPGRHHLLIAKILAKIFDVVIVVPCGKRPDKDSANILALKHRKAMIRIALEGVAKVKIDYHDLENDIYTPTYYLQERYEKLYPDFEIWHVAGSDLVKGGREGYSEIQRIWDLGGVIWQSLNWVVIYRPGHEIAKGDLPPSSMVVKIPNIFGSGTMIRGHLAEGRCIDNLAMQEVVEYIRKHNLYKRNLKE